MDASRRILKTDNSQKKETKICHFPRTYHVTETFEAQEISADEITHLPFLLPSLSGRKLQEFLIHETSASTLHVHRDPTALEYMVMGDQKHEGCDGEDSAVHPSLPDICLSPFDIEIGEEAHEPADHDR